MKRYNTSAKSNGLSRLGPSILCLLVTFWPIAIAIANIITTAAAVLRLFHLLYIFFFRIFFTSFTRFAPILEPNTASSFQ